MDTSIKFQKRAYLWAHFGTGDIMKHAVGYNMPRIRSQRHDSSKSGPLAVIARNEETFKDLTLAKTRIFAEARQRMETWSDIHQGGIHLHKNVAAVRRTYKAALDPNYVPGGHPDKSARSFDKGILATLAQADLAEYTKVTSQKKTYKQNIDKAARRLRSHSEYCDAISGTTILKISAVDMKAINPKNSRLYILGHGAAGSGYISPTECASHRVALRDIASGLAKSGLLSTVEDIRLLSCHSADAKIPIAFHPGFDAPDSTGGLFGFFQSHAPARVLSNAMAKRGFKNVYVTGYHGAADAEPEGMHQRQRPNAESPDSSAVRASLVKKVFTSGK